MHWIKRNLFPLLASGFIASYVWFAASHIIAHAQKPEASMNTYNGTLALETSADPIYVLQLEGEQIATYDPKKKALSISDKTFGSWVESHCVAVLSPARDIDHEEESRNNLMPHFNDTHPTGIEHIPEQVLKLRCTKEVN